MWLINVATRDLENFNDERALPSYAILSHTWTGSEVTMQQYREVAGDVNDQGSQLKLTQGYSKIEATCLQACADELPYVWVDTCCIDKTSSAELSEAINSMFRWYQLARVCYVLLEDVSAEYWVGDQGAVPELDCPSLSRARWFTRGWTLQELIAPRAMSFFDKNWKLFGTKETLRSTLAGITGIDEPYLGGADIRTASVARRMSWAAGRITTKVEDIAYSLFGIFDVNMPLLYGEGMKAFQRLQEEILNNIDDHSLFAWQTPEVEMPSTTDLFFRPALPVTGGVSIFAEHPRYFIVSSKARPYVSGAEASMAGGKGLKIRCPLFKLAPGGLSRLRVAILNCSGATYLSGERTGIVLQELSSGHYMRYPGLPLVQVDATQIKPLDYRTIYIRKTITATIPAGSNLETSRVFTREIGMRWRPPMA